MPQDPKVRVTRIQAEWTPTDDYSATLLHFAALLERLLETDNGYEHTDPWFEASDKARAALDTFNGTKENT